MALPDAPHTDAVVPATVGTALWLIALLAGLATSATSTWIAGCAAGFVLGLMGLSIALVRRTRYREAGRSASGQS